MKRIAIVTGASSGIGREMAKQIAQDSVNWPINEIWLIARRAERLAELSLEIASIRNNSKDNSKDNNNLLLPVALPLDISSKDGRKAFLDKLSDANNSGKIIIALLVNNAGFGTYGPFAETDTAKEINMAELNCTTLTAILGYSLPYMERGSVVINTASLAAFMPLGNFAVYGATKAFVLSLSISLAAEVKDMGIKVCALCPGPVSTEFALVASGGKRKEVRHGISAEQVVQKALKDARRGKAISMMKLKWKIIAFLSRFAGRMLCARITYKFCPRPHTNTGTSLMMPRSRSSQQ